MRSLNASSRYPSAARSIVPGIFALSFAVFACGGSTAAPPPPQPPSLSSSAPLDGATGVALNARLSAFFDSAMAPLSETTFTLKQGTTAVAGTVATSGDGTSATFSPSSSLAASSVFTATISAAAKSLAGDAMGADTSWSFTTGAAADTSAPVVSATSPASDASGVGLNAKISVAFSKAMDPLSLSPTSVTVKQAGAQVPGSVTYGPGETATFTPASALAANTLVTATVTADAKDLEGNSLAAAYTWSFTTGATTTPLEAPLLTSTAPSDGAIGVPLNVKLSASFDVRMYPLGAAAFTLKQGSTVVPGKVVTNADGMTATFTPSSSLKASTVFTATIAAAAKSAAGVALGADSSWSFTTGAAADTSGPTVTATSPANTASGVIINTKISATFSKAMDPLSITAASFTVKQGTTPVSGRVVYGPGTTATFSAFNPFASNAIVTVTLTTSLKDLAGNPLANQFSWSFTTGTTAAKGPSPVLLGTAGNFVLLAKTAISTVPTSAVTGDIGVSPAAATYLTGFSLIADSTNVFATSPQIVGKAYAANYAVPTPSNMTTAVSNMETAYTDAAGRPTPDFLELGTGNIGGKTLAPGLYKWTSTITIPTDVTLSGGANDVWIFQTSKDITMASAQHVILSGGALAKNVFWQVAGHVILGTGAHFEGVVLCKTDVTLQTGATMNGRVLSQTAVSLQKATVTQPAQ